MKKDTLKKNIRLIMLAVLAVVVLLIPLTVNNYYLGIFIEIILYAYMASCWNILGGFAGQFSLGHALYIGIGAYTSTVLFNTFGLTPWAGMIVGGILATLIGLVVGIPTFKLSGTFYTLASVAVSTIFMLLFQSTRQLGIFQIGGATGLQVFHLNGNRFLYLQFANKKIYYYLFLAFLVLILLLCRWIKRSKLGYQLAAIANDQLAAEALGVNSRLLKLKAMAISTFSSAIGGTLYAQYIMACSPKKLFGEALSDELVILALVGGRGAILGPTIGSVLIRPIATLTTAMFGGSIPGLHLALYGALLIVCIRFFPNGLYPILTGLWGRIANKDAARDKAEEES